jgi:subtilase family serine protease
VSDTGSDALCNHGRFRCKARIAHRVKNERGFAAAAGLGAADLADAYKLDTSIDPGVTVAVVDAYGYAKAEADLAQYRSNYGLPACTVANGCLTIVNHLGNPSPLPPEPPSDADWTTETALDLDMVSAGCPKCKILLVQAANDSDDSLFIAQATAARLGATVISDSWGSSETATDKAATYDHYFAIPGVQIFVASGDKGYDNGGDGPDFPSTSTYVTGVGGTNLKKATGTARGWTETAWGGFLASLFGAGGSSCSISIAKPSWQTPSTSCSFRAASDVAAVGDPLTPPAIYHGGWTAVGGTSAAAPLVAGIYALTGKGKAAPSFAYQHPEAFFDVTSGSNGSCGNVLCNAGRGWDGPTGMGTPNGAAIKTAACTPSCTGKTCGNDGCGGSCGSCGDGTFCGPSGACVANCVPSCKAGQKCGNDGCGGITCGVCAHGQVCNDAETACVAAPASH